MIFFNIYPLIHLICLKKIFIFIFIYIKGFCPLSTFIEKKDVSEPHNLFLSLEINGKKV